MARAKTLRFAVINIKTQPHSPEKYRNLMYNVFRSKNAVKIRGNDWGLIGSLTDRTVNKNNCITGIFYKFLNIDPRGVWLDLRDHSPLSVADKDAPPIVPEHLKPNLKEIEFIFFPQGHRLFFETNDISPNSIKRLLENLFSDKSIKKEFGEVDVSVESSEEAIDKILSIPRITRLEISLSRPNDDVLSGLEKRVLVRMQDQNVRKLHETLTTTDQGGIEADKETKALMNVATSNGKVLGKGYDGDTAIERSTEQHPLIKSISYNPDLETRLGVMLKSSLSILPSLMNK